MLNLKAFRVVHVELDDSVSVLAQAGRANPVETAIECLMAEGRRAAG